MCWIIPSSLGKYRRSFKRHQKEFLAPLSRRIFNIYQVPNHKYHLLAIYIICHLPLVFLSPTSQKFAILFASLFPFAVFSSDISFACNHAFHSRRYHESLHKFLHRNFQIHESQAKVHKDNQVHSTH